MIVQGSVKRNIKHSDVNCVYGNYNVFYSIKPLKKKRDGVNTTPVPLPTFKFEPVATPLKPVAQTISQSISFECNLYSLLFIFIISKSIFCQGRIHAISI